jgi:hypothetical protein
MGWYLVLGVVFVLIAWLLRKVWKAYALQSLTGLHRIPIAHSDYKGLFCIVNYNAPAHMWDIDFVGIEDGKDLWDEMTDIDKAIVQVDINIFLCDIRSKAGVPY